MPSDDLVINVKQIANYVGAVATTAGDALLLQRGGLGGPYLQITPAILVGSALAQGGDMVVMGTITAERIQVGQGQFSNAAFGLLDAQKASIQELNLLSGLICGSPIASRADLDALAGSLFVTVVTGFNGRRGDVCLWLEDIVNAGGAPICSPCLQGCPTAPTPDQFSANDQIATTAFVNRSTGSAIATLLTTQPFVFTFNGRSGDVVLTAADLVAAGMAPLDSPQFTGVPTAPTALAGDVSHQLANTEFVTLALGASGFAPINSPAFTGLPTGPTAAPGTNTGQLATTAFVTEAIADSTTGVSSFNTRVGAVTLQAGDITGASGALLASPIFTGIPQAPTAGPATNNNQIATTAYVTAALATSGGVSSFNARTGVVVLTAGDITGAGGAILASPTFTGTPAAPTALVGTNTTQLATTAFVQSAVAAGTAGVASFNGRTGIVTLAANDVSAAGGALIASPLFTGTPSAPTAAPGTNTGQLATTAYVQAAITAVAAGVTSFNSRQGVVTLTSADITGAGGALAASSVASFNTRVGAVTLTAADLTGVGGALSANVLALTGGTLTGLLVLPRSGFTVPAPVTASGAITVPLPNGEFQNVSLTGNASIAVSGWPASGIFAKLVLTISNAGGFNILGWPAGTIWPGGSAPTITATAGGKDVIALMSSDGGTTVYGSIIGQNYH
jgi:hypothetical protein